MISYMELNPQKGSLVNVDEPLRKMTSITHLGAMSQVKSGRKKLQRASHRDVIKMVEDFRSPV